MQSIRCLALAAVALFMAGCSSFTSESATPLARGAQWGLVPLLNYSQAPQAGERAEQILLSVLAEEACGRACARRSRKATCNWSTTASASSARWTGHASRSWPTWSPAASRVAVQERPRRRAGGGRQPAGAGAGLRAGALEHQRGARRLVPGKPGGRRAESPARAGRRPAARVTAMSAHKDFALAARASGSVSWVETLVISALALGLGWWFSPDDPLQVNATFPWVILAPLLLGMRYGFVRGLASAALLVAALFAFRVQGVEAYAQVPAAFIVGVLLCAMLVGEFRDIWERRLERLELANEYRQLRLDEFTRAHHILRISTIAWNSGSPATTRACAVRCSVCDNCCASCRAMRHRSMRWRKPCWRCWPSTVRCASPDSTGCATTAPRSRNPWRRSARCRRWTPTTCWCAPAWSAANWSACARNCWSVASSVRTARCRCACRWSTPMGGSSPCWRWSRCRSSSSTNVPSACWRSSPGTSPTCCRATVAHCNWPTSTPSASPSTSSAPCWTPATMGCRPACMPSS